MTEEKLRHTLQELQIELDKLHFDNETDRRNASQSIVQLEEKLREESFMSGDEYIVHELVEALEQFEESHPVLRELASRIADLLNKMGI